MKSLLSWGLGLGLAVTLAVWAQGGGPAKLGLVAGPSPTRQGDVRLAGSDAASPKPEGEGEAEQITATTKLKGLYGQVDPEVSLVVEDLELKDKARGKTLPFRVTYPKGEGRFPVIVWSHSLFGGQDLYRPLVEHWARHGYMVVQPGHSDRATRGKARPKGGAPEALKDWQSRPKDISFLIDSLARTPSAAAKHADLARLGVGGHSFGAHTTMLTEGAQPRGATRLADPRPKAFLAMSPQGEGKAFDVDSWKGLTRPTMFISGDNDGSFRGEKARWRLEPFQKSPAGDKFLLWIKGGHHNLGGITGVMGGKDAGPPKPDHVALVQAATLAFWDSYLKSDPQAAQVLHSGRLGREASSLYRWEER